MATGLAIVAIGLANPDLLTKPEVQLPIVLIATVLAVVGGLSFLVIVLAYLGLTTPDAALGMPEGSIRAVIAISLLFLFMILSVFLYVNLAKAGNSSAPDIAKQLITTVATLAVSVAGFYFGTSSVAAAAKAVAQQTASLRIVSPSSPQTLDKTEGNELVDIRVDARPTGAALDWDVSGDVGGQLMQTEPYVFTYRRGPKPADLVTLRFSLDSYPDVSATLEVKAPDLKAGEAQAPKPTAGG
jgi:hypothetical protein